MEINSRIAALIEMGRKAKANAIKVFVSYPGARAAAEDMLTTAPLDQPSALEGLADRLATEITDELEERYGFLETQRNDLETSMEDLNRTIAELSRTTRSRFRETFEKANEKFAELFVELFRGGSASLKLTNPNNLLDGELRPVGSFSTSKELACWTAIVLPASSRVPKPPGKTAMALASLTKATLRLKKYL